MSEMGLQVVRMACSINVLDFITKPDAQAIFVGDGNHNSFPQIAKKTPGECV